MKIKYTTKASVSIIAHLTIFQMRILIVNLAISRVRLVMVSIILNHFQNLFSNIYTIIKDQASLSANLARIISLWWANNVKANVQRRLILTPVSESVEFATAVIVYGASTTLTNVQSAIIRLFLIRKFMSASRVAPNPKIINRPNVVIVRYFITACVLKRI